jgi:hypothetical protein
MRKYRIIEEKYEHVSHFWPQYRDENVAYYVLGKDENGKVIKSDYQYFGRWEDCFSHKQWKKDFFYDMSNARHRIEMDIQQQTVEELKETIIHEY